LLPLQVLLLLLSVLLLLWRMMTPPLQDSEDSPVPLLLLLLLPLPALQVRWGPLAPLLLLLPVLLLLLVLLLLRLPVFQPWRTPPVRHLPPCLQPGPLLFSWAGLPCVQASGWCRLWAC
jgi:hypothetical protein